MLCIIRLDFLLIHGNSLNWLKPHDILFNHPVQFYSMHECVVIKYPQPCNSSTNLKFIFCDLRAYVASIGNLFK